MGLFGQVIDYAQGKKSFNDISDGQGGIRGVGGAGDDGFLSSLGNIAGNRGQNEFRDLNQSNFGLPGYQTGMDQRDQMAGRFQGQGSSFRGGQQNLMGLLEQRARGQGPSMADMQMQRGMQSAGALQQALAASGRGNPAMAARQAAINTGNMTQNLAGQGAMARVAETQGAQGLLGQMLGQARGQDIGQQGLNNQSELEARRQQLLLQQMQQQGNLAYETQRGNRFNSLMGQPTQQEKGLGMVSSLAGMIPGL